MSMLSLLQVKTETEEDFDWPEGYYEGYDPGFPWPNEYIKLT